MKLGNYKEEINKELNKWYIILQYTKDYATADRRLFRFGIFNFKKFPKVGELISKEYYKGFMFIRCFRHPLTIVRQFLEFKGY